MNGISPKMSSMSALQTQTSAEISTALPEFPTTISDLISQLAVPDFSLAARPLDLDKNGEVIQSPKNLETISFIELALTSPSTECDPAIKSTIFSNAADNSYSNGGILRDYLANIINNLKARALQVILDDTVIQDLDLTYVGRIDLGGMSAKRAIFKEVNMDYLQMESADLSGAQFLGASLENANLNKANIVDATFSKVFFRNTAVSELTFNQYFIFKYCSSKIETRMVNVVPVRISQATLTGSDISAIPDIEKSTLPVSRILALVPEES